MDNIKSIEKHVRKLSNELMRLSIGTDAYMEKSKELQNTRSILAQKLVLCNNIGPQNRK